MPLPAILAGAAAVLAPLIWIDQLFYGGRVSDELSAKIGKKAAQAVLDARGIPLDLDGEVNQQTITEAINVGVMPEGVRFENLFDKDQIKRDIKRIALEQAASQFGFEGSTEPSVIRRQIIDKITAEVRAEISAGGGEFMDAAKGLAETQRLIDRPEPKDWQKIRNFSDKAEKNRARQEAYRASHNRKWVEI